MHLKNIGVLMAWLAVLDEVTLKVLQLNKWRWVE
jgi:hypothetical protein